MACVQSDDMVVSKHILHLHENYISGHANSNICEPVCTVTSCYNIYSMQYMSTVMH